MMPTVDHKNASEGSEAFLCGKSRGNVRQSAFSYLSHFRYLSIQGTDRHVGPVGLPQ